MKALEVARADKQIGKSLDAKVTVYAPDGETFAVLDAFRAELPTVFIVSQVELVKGDAPAGAREEDAPIGVTVSPAEGEKCDRCWNFTTSPFHDGEGTLCPRCRRVLKL